jgi:endonuclease VIII
VPEGDTVYLAATRLHAALAGGRLTKTDFRIPAYATLDLAGKKVEEVVARGKHILFRLSNDTTVHTQLKMDGTWHLYRHGARWQDPAWQVRVVFYTEKWVAVGYRLPVVDVLPTAREDEVIGYLGPDPLGDDWDEAEAAKRMLADSNRAVEEALLDQRVIAGLGNIYRNEICFLTGVRPDKPVRDVPDVPGMVALAARLMQANRRTGNQITTGDARRGRTHWVYGRRAQPCRRCGTAIEKEGDGKFSHQRVTYYCPYCQA